MENIEYKKISRGTIKSNIAVGDKVMLNGSKAGMVLEVINIRTDGKDNIADCDTGFKEVPIRTYYVSDLVRLVRRDLH